VAARSAMIITATKLNKTKKTIIRLDFVSQTAKLMKFD